MTSRFEASVQYQQGGWSALFASPMQEEWPDTLGPFRSEAARDLWFDANLERRPEVITYHVEADDLLAAGYSNVALYKERGVSL